MVPKWKIAIFFLLLGSSLTLVAFKIFDISFEWLGLGSVTTGPRPLEDRLSEAMYGVLFDYGIHVEWISEKDNLKIVRTPRDLLPIELYVDLASTFEDLGGELLRAESNPDGDRMTLEVGLKNEGLFQVTLARDETIKRTAGRLAIVIGDLGENFGSGVEGFIDLEQELTFAIVPGLNESQDIAEAVFVHNRDILIHVAAESQNGHSGSGEFGLSSEMETREIRERIRAAVQRVPHARGLVNHITLTSPENRRLATILMEEVKRAKLCFVDAAAETPMNAHAPVGQNTAVLHNDLFLDTIQDEPYVRKKLTTLAELATKEGYAVAVCRPNEETLEVLREDLPKLEKKGFRFVPISQIQN